MELSSFSLLFLKWGMVEYQTQETLPPKKCSKFYVKINIILTQEVFLDQEQVKEL